MRRSLARRIVNEAARRGYTLTRKALEMLESAENPLKILEKAIAELMNSKTGSRIIDENDLRKLLHPRVPEPKLEEKPLKEEPTPPISIDERFLKEYRLEGSADEFQRYFKSRYENLRGILMERLSGVVDLKSALKLREGQEAYVIVMMSERKESDRAWLLRVDDPSAETKIIVPKNRGLGESAESILPDAVFGIRVVKRGSSLIAKELVLPDVAQEEIRKENFNVNVCLISDIHVGSKKFRKDLFESFLNWINRPRDPEVKRIKFLVVAGDLVDGVGVYPRQQKELEVTSIKDQLRMLSKLLSEIPEKIKVILAPGNHDPAQRALPQPPIPEQYRRILEEGARSFIFVGNPAWIRIGGRRFLIYHGQGLDDIIQLVPGFSHSTLKENIGRALELLLKHRHLAPVYGETTPILPLEEDLLVIDKVPDVLHVGHVHIAYAGSYRGIRLINTGAWQEQTSYQRNIGLEPTVGVAAVVNLGDLSIRVKQFM